MAAEAPPLVTLNVGGQLFTALRATLCSRPGSLLAAMFSGEWEPTAVHDERGHPYIDRNPTHFHDILGFMRDGAAPVPDTSAQRQALRAEASYFGCWPLVEAIDAAEEHHTRIEVSVLTLSLLPKAAREQRLLEEACMAQERLELLNSANSELEACTAAADAARAKMIAVAADMAAAQDEASAAGRQLEDGLIAIGERLRQRRRLHAAALRWHALRVQYTAAGEALESLRVRQRAAKTAKLAAIHVSQAVELGGEVADPPRRIQPREPLPRVAPPADFDAWDTMAGQRQPGAEAAGLRMGGFADFFGLRRGDDDEPWGRNGNGPAANFVADERGNAWAAPPRFNRAWRAPMAQAAPAAPAQLAADAEHDADLDGQVAHLAQLHQRLAALRRRRPDGDDDEQVQLLRRIVRQHIEREGQEAGAARPRAAIGARAAAAQEAGNGPGDQGPAAAQAAAAQPAAAVAPGGPAVLPEPAPALEGEAVAEPPAPVAPNVLAGLQDEADAEDEPDPEAPVPAMQQAAVQPAQPQAPVPSRAQPRAGRRAREQQPVNHQQQLERGWGRRRQPAAKRE